MQQKHTALILDNATYEHDLKDFSFTFVELPKFTKKLADLQTIEEQWYYFLKHADESNNIADVLAHHPEIKQAYEILDRYHWTENELQSYEKSVMNVADSKGIMDAARNEGRHEGRKEGIQQGHTNVARKMIESGMPVDQVVKFTGLTEQEIRNIPGLEGLLVFSSSEKN